MTWWPGVWRYMEAWISGANASRQTFQGEPVRLCRRLSTKHVWSERTLRKEDAKLEKVTVNHNTGGNALRDKLPSTCSSSGKIDVSDKHDHGAPLHEARCHRHGRKLNTVWQGWRIVSNDIDIDDRLPETTFQLRLPLLMTATNLSVNSS